MGWREEFDFCGRLFDEFGFWIARRLRIPRRAPDEGVGG